MKNAKNSKNLKGQALVETALVLPIILLVLMGIIDLGLLFNNYLVISNASREGARLAAVGNMDADIETSIRNMTASLKSDNLQIEVTPTDANRKKGDEVTLSLTYKNLLLTPIISALVPNPINLNSKTVMRVE